jgi:PPOX class probable F420-dependent enzyme
MELAQALEFARGVGRGVLVTTRINGRPQLSNITFAVAEDGVIRISITAERAKYRNLLREPWGALHVTREDFYAYAVIEGEVTLSAVAAVPQDAAVEELVALYRAIGGEHEDWDDYRAAMVRDQRVVVRIAPTRAYGMLPD